MRPARSIVVAHGLRQSGVVLLIALIALVAITLAGIALMRSVDTGLVIAGNLAFKQTATQVGDAGTEAAIAWLAQNSANLANDNAAAGYYASWREGCDVTGGRTSTVDDDVVWQAGAGGAAACGMVAVPVPSARLPDGYAANYVINRMCNAEGAPNQPGVYCSAFQSTSSGGSGSTKGGASYGQMPLSGTTQQYYRITTRVEGPRNTVSFVQAFVAF
ncbi:MAG: hypothetical protein AB1768_16820 [Pseudomonadota bacterium]